MRKELVACRGFEPGTGDTVIPQTLGSVSDLCLPRGGYSGNHDPAREFPKVMYVKTVNRRGEPI